METRKYTDEPLNDAAIILSEVCTTGKSNGWQGTTEQLEERKEQLAYFNVRYVDDMRGTWRLRCR